MPQGPLNCEMENEMNSPSHMISAGPSQIAPAGALGRWAAVIALGFVLGVAASNLAHDAALPITEASVAAPVLEDWHGNVMRSHWTR